jgi:TonB family protein
MGMRAALPAALASLALPALALAQGTSDPAAASAEVRAVAERVEAEIACLGRVQTELRRVLRQIDEARAQMSSARASDRDRADARASIESLSQRAVELVRRVPACRSQLSRAASTAAPVGGVIVRRQGLEGNASAVGAENPATDVVERDTPLAENVGVVVGERVDGYGTLDAAVVRAAIRSIGAQLSQCYERTVGEGALREGSIILTFTVSSSGHVGRVETERSRFSRRFDECVRDAGRHIQVGRAPSGGDVAYSYTLRFPSS